MIKYLLLLTFTTPAFSTIFHSDRELFTKNVEEKCLEVNNGSKDCPLISRVMAVCTAELIENENISNYPLDADPVKHLAVYNKNGIGIDYAASDAVYNKYISCVGREIDKEQGKK